MTPIHTDDTIIEEVATTVVGPVGQAERDRAAAYLRQVTAERNYWKDQAGQAQAATLRQIAAQVDLLKVGKTAVVLYLDMMRTNQMSLSPGINTGLVIADKDGTRSTIIRLGIADSLKIGLKAIADELDERVNPT